VKAVLRVFEPGLLTTVQDLGRPHAIAGGVPPGGAMDRFAHQAANLLAGNDVNEATIECTLSGPRLLLEARCLVAVTGADLDLKVDGAPAPMWTGIVLEPGAELAFGRRQQGARAYIAVAGGFEADRWLGSRSTSLMAARGGFHGRALAAGDSLTVAVERNEGKAGRHLPYDLRPDYSDHALAVIAGPHLGRLDAGQRRRLFESEFTVSHEADRMGYRLEGPRLVTSGEELLSFGLVRGAVQVTHGGGLILLMADHQTAGGYPVVATVITACLPQAAQLVPGDELRFVETTVDEARRLRAARRAALDSLRDAAGPATRPRAAP
jgi:antagonist of KipI